MTKRFAMASGRLIDIDNLKSEDICLNDIAHHLAKIQRGNGCLPLGIKYSVAEHSINLYNWCVENHQYDTLAQRWLILHDASEAYLSDMVRPVKEILHDYKVLENSIQSMIYEKYIGGQSPTYNIMRADKRILMDEMEHLCPEQLDIYRTETGLTKLGCHIEYNNDEHTVKQVFLNICKKLGISDDL